ncbi:MAG: RNA repair transcriptional activator RtcR [Methylobacter sp.]|uniref:RNA repair transcriptional activator RtcR n=1 Tax=Methylobacter sp. TaxID=2051955 RepID=UPI0025893C31|nr:RNA repair transcriptional activator RtcR [Methylobacter sp.]MCL7421004.1 RNA repair transcriptional activator RtcR [Methylobacter sp.]
MKTVVISLLGTTLDHRGFNSKRWERWRPTLSLCQHEDLVVDRLELLFQRDFQNIAGQLSQDIKTVSPETEVHHHMINLADPWDFESVYAELLDFARSYPFDIEHEQYLLHITTGTHVAQICLYLLTEARYLPGRLIQTSPPHRQETAVGHYQIIDLDLSKYDLIASRFSREHQEGTHYLKGGIETRNPAFNRMIEQVEKVAIRSREPILLTGPSGSGKSLLAKRIYQLKKKRGQLPGNLVEVNCATLRGDNAMSALFGHVKGAFTGAATARKGLLAEADNGLLFLDEIGELGLDEQAMLLRAIEDKRFMPMGSDKETSSRFQLIAGTNRNLFQQVEQGRFREDLLARINLWSYELPSLKQRLEDLEANIDYELEKYSQKANTLIGFNKQARDRYLRFAKSPEAIWNSNFRDLNASITRMATLSDGGRITPETVEDEIRRLRHDWRQSGGRHEASAIESLLDRPVDLFDRLQLAGVIRICQDSQTAAEAGRKLFNVSRLNKASANDSHRVIQFLGKFGLDFKAVKQWHERDGSINH